MSGSEEMDDRAAAAGALVTLRTRVGHHFEDALKRSPDQFACTEGCAQCCHRRFGVFEVEAAPIRRALAEMADRDPSLRDRVRRQATDPALADRCALLVDDRCAVYDARPLICRAHGLPTLVRDVTDPGTARIDVCPLNFQDATPPRPSLLAMEAVNQPLAVMAEMYAPGADRVDLAELAATRDEKNL